MRWYTSAGAALVTASAKATRLERLRWEMVKSRSQLVPRYDVISVDNIIGPAYNQPEPDNEGFFYHNRYVF